MTIVNVVLTLNDKEIVPVRAIPFVTGGDMGPRCLASILFEPVHDFWAFTLGADNAVTPIAPKNWLQYKALLSTAGSDSSDLYVQSTLEILPASTFVYWEGLWRTYEANFMPDREVIYGLPPIERENYVLKKCPDIPELLVESVFAGFDKNKQLHQPLQEKNNPRPVSTSDIADSFAGFKWNSAEEWLKPLGDKPKWLVSCIATPGSQGVHQTHWNPVLIGAALVRRYDVPVNHIRGRFQTKHHLKLWLEVWKDYEADNFPGN
jgi:hypothetical protein